MSLDAGRLTRTSRGRAGGALLVAVSMVVALVAAAPAALAAEPGLVAVEAISAHRLLATFDQEPNAVALKATNYTITGPNGSSLAVLALSALGNKQALVSTAAQQAVPYQIKGPEASSPPRAFTGSTDLEPKLLRAESQSSTRVLLTFSEAMGAGAGEAARYQITEVAQQGSTTPPPPSGGSLLGGLGALGGLVQGVVGLLPGLTSPASGGGAVTVTAATVDAQNPARVTLTTTQQSARDYDVRVGDVKGQSGEYVDPTANSARFAGLPPVDTTPPRLVSATPRDERTLVLAFDKPLHHNAADPARYASTPNLFIQGASLQNSNREVVLGTGVQFAVTYTVTADVVDAGGTAVSSSARSATFTGSRAVNTERPRVVSATSTGNTKVVVQFSKPMADNTANPARWRIDQQSPGVGSVAITGAAFVDSERVAVELTTGSQSEVNYRASVADVTDLLGNPMADRGASGGVAIDPTAAPFLGTAPSGDSLVDTDGDRLYDHEETTSREVVVRLATGEVRRVQVTSDPQKADTDGDGLDDFVEKGLAIDPRDADTDDDGLTDAEEFNEIFSDPAIQDTDGDTLADGLEVTFYNSSAILADTDGDQLPDGVETSLAKRNVRVADLPKPALEIGEMNLFLDVRFTENTATESKEIEARSEKATLVQSAKEEFANVTSRTLEAGGKFTEEAGYTLEVKLGHEAGVTNTFETKFTAEQSFNSTYLTSFTDTSTRETASTFEKSLDTTAETTQGATVSREVQGAAITAGVVLESEGDIAFTIRNLQVTALMPHPTDPAVLTAVATLLPEAEPSTGYTLGPLVPQRGPITFRSQQVFPSLVEGLMRDPRGVVLKFSNYDITDELGRNFAFTSQEINDRTAALVLDFGGVDTDGDGTGDLTEIHRVATGIGSRFDSNGDGVVDHNDRKRVFDANGQQVGITLREALAAIGLTAYDETANPTSSLSQQQINTSYSTMIDGNGREVVFRVRSTKIIINTPRRWEILTETGVDRSLNLDSYILQPGTSVNLSFLQDLDRDRVPAHLEALNRCSDQARDTDGDTLDDRYEVYVGWDVDIRGIRRVFSSCASVDTDGDGLADDKEAPGFRDLGPDELIIIDGPNKPRRDEFWTPISGLDDSVAMALHDPITDPASRDSDGDGIADGTEIAGYPVKVRATGVTQTFRSSPEHLDTDGDTASDGIERVLGGNPLDKGDFATFGDSDGDGLVDVQETTGWEVTFVDVVPVTDKSALCRSVCAEGVAGTPVQATSMKNDRDSDDDGLTDLEEFQLKTHPMKKDTDNDGLTDFEEVRGYHVRDLGVIFTNPLDADTDNDKRKDGDEAGRGARLIVRVPGLGPYEAFSHPLDPDTDLDQLVDGEELDWNDAKQPADPSKFDTDGDGRDDYAEAKSSRRVLVADLAVTVDVSRLLIEEDGGDLPGEFRFQFGVQRSPGGGSELLVNSASLDLENCEPVFGFPVDVLCRDPDPPADGLERYVRLGDGTSLPVSGRATFGSVSTTDAVFEQLRFYGYIQEWEGDAKLIDCEVRLPDFGTGPGGVNPGLLAGKDLRVGIHSFNLTREASCLGGEKLKFTLYATYTAN